MRMSIRSEMPGDGPYTVRELIEALQKCANQDAPVGVYLLDSVRNCEYAAMGRYPVVSVDDSFENHRKVDLNVTSDMTDYLERLNRKEEQNACTEIH